MTARRKRSVSQRWVVIAQLHNQGDDVTAAAWDRQHDRVRAVLDAFEKVRRHT